MNELSLFTGIGGGLLGTHLLGFRPICAVEKEPYCREVLLQRQRDGVLPMFPLWDDIKTFKGKSWRGVVDIVTAGFPCTPWSVAGKRKGKDDEHNLWPETIRIIREVRPAFSFLENVPGLTVREKLILFDTVEEGRVFDGDDWGEHLESFRKIHEVPVFFPSYFGRILGDLAENGYDAKWCVLGADDVGAPHRRKRLWILAHAKFQKGRTLSGCGEDKKKKGKRASIELGGCGKDVADPNQFNDDSGGHGASKIQRKRSTKADLRKGEQNNLANPESKQGRGVQFKELETNIRASCKWWDQDPADIPDTNGDGLSEAGKSGASIGGDGVIGKDGGSTEPGMGRVAHGVANRVDRLKALGNGQVSGVVRQAWETLIERAGS